MQKKNHPVEKMYMLLTKFDQSDQKKMYTRFKKFASKFHDYDLYQGGLEHFVDKCIFKENSFELMNHELFNTVFQNVVKNNITQAKKHIEGHEQQQVQAMIPMMMQPQTKNLSSQIPFGSYIVLGITIHIILRHII